MEEYEEQLRQIQHALQNVQNEDDRRNLESLENDIKQLISLSFLESLEADESTSTEKDLEKSTEDESTISRLEQYDHLINQKFRAPHNTNGTTSFHNAFISSIEDAKYDDVFVKIFFLQPLIDKMKVCEYFMNGKCNFNENCKYSHGEIVLYSELQPYIDPDYKILKRKIHVLTKNSESSLWCPATVMSCDRDERNCQLKLQNGKNINAQFEDILPPFRNDNDSDLSSSSDEESNNKFESFEDSLNSIVKFQECSAKFGEWEKFTSGFGSKMLKKLGYQLGQGLGKNGEGRIEPVEAKIYVTGKSIDWNMERNILKSGKNLTVEEKWCRKESSKYMEKSEGKRSNSKDDMFAFINQMNKINKKSEENKPKIDIKAQSKQQLNQNNFQISEDIKKLNKSISKLKESQKRLKSEPASLKIIELQLKAKEAEINKLKSQLTAIDREQEMRKGRSKLAVF